MAIRGEGGKWKPSGGRSLPNVPVERRTLSTYRFGEFKNGGTVVKEALMLVSSKAKRRRGRPD